VFELLFFECGGWPGWNALQLSCCRLAARPQVFAAESRTLATPSISGKTLMEGICSCGGKTIRGDIISM
jgi:hypothetical protein